MLALTQNVYCNCERQCYVDMVIDDIVFSLVISKTSRFDIPNILLLIIKSFQGEK